MTGNEYKRLIGSYVAHVYGERGLQVYEEVPLGTTIIGKQRRIDLFIVNAEGRALAVECKFQDSSGTVDEKIPYALRDMETQRIPGVVVYAGRGFSPGVLHLLQGSEMAAYALPEADSLNAIPRKSGLLDSGTWQLDHVIAQTFLYWDIIIGSKRPVDWRALAPLPSATEVAAERTASVTPSSIKKGETTPALAMPTPDGPRQKGLGLPEADQAEQ